MALVKLLVSLETFAGRCTAVVFRTPPKGCFSTMFSSLLRGFKNSTFVVTFYFSSEECFIISFSFTEIINMCMTK